MWVCGREDGDCKSLQIYCVQTQAVQCYQLSLKELELVATAPPTPIRGSKNTEIYFDADVEQEEHDDDEEEEEQEPEDQEDEGAIATAELDVLHRSDASMNEVPSDLHDLSMQQAPNASDTAIQVGTQLQAIL